MLESSLPPHCTPINSFLRQASIYFGACLPTPLGFISTLLGNLSILSWLCAQLPQVYKNFQLKSAAGLSIFFLIEWLLGDLTNLIGGILTEQATWQVVLASYYVAIDTCLVVQYIWYSHVLPKWRAESLYSNGSEAGDDADSDIINSLSPINSSFHEDQREHAKISEDDPPKLPHTHPIDTPRFSQVNYEKATMKPSPSFTHDKIGGFNWSGPSPRTVMYAATLSSMVSKAAAAPTHGYNEIHVLHPKAMSEVIGTVISWSSTFLYLGSRLPQLYKNWQRQSTAGLSPYLFLAAFCGNLFYSTSMLTNPSAWNNFGPYGGHGWVDEDGNRRKEWLLNAAPFFLGAFGVLFMDATMGIQFLMYGEEVDKIVKVRDGKGSSRWQRVSGWMRGWIPSISKEKVVDLAESQRLLTESRELDRHTFHSQYGGI